MAGGHGRGGCGVNGLDGLAYPNAIHVVLPQLGRGGLGRGLVLVFLGRRHLVCRLGLLLLGPFGVCRGGLEARVVQSGWGGCCCYWRDGSSSAAATGGGGKEGKEKGRRALDEEHEDEEEDEETGVGGASLPPPLHGVLVRGWKWNARAHADWILEWGPGRGGPCGQASANPALPVDGDQ